MQIFWIIFLKHLSTYIPRYYIVDFIIVGGGSKFTRNVGIHLSSYTVSHLRRQWNRRLNISWILSAFLQARFRFIAVFAKRMNFHLFRLYSDSVLRSGEDNTQFRLDLPLEHLS
jgi:hypothetical protein